MKRKFMMILMAGMLVSAFTGCRQEETDGTEMTHIQLSDEGIKVDGEEISTEETSAVYQAKDIVFYLADQGFTYGEGEAVDEHTQEEADQHTVVHITQPGEYVLSGQLSAGQIAVDLGKEAKEDPEAVVTLYLNGVDITCDVAPAVIFYNVYECGSKEKEDAVKEVDTSKAGANVVIMDDTVNQIEGSYVARIYESVTLNEDGTEIEDSEKLHKYDGAFYSKMSMNIDGGEADTGMLNILAENEGLDSELHLTINGGNINIESGNDGINTNEDNVSVTTVNGGSLHIIVNGNTGEGDGIDSNGWLVINGGTVTASACGISGDAGIDSDMGIYLNGGTVMASGNMLDRIAGNEQSYVLFTTRERLSGNKTYTLRDKDQEILCEYTPANDFMYLIFSLPELSEEGSYTLWEGETQVAEGVFGMNGAGGPMGGPGMGDFGNGGRDGFGGQKGEWPEGERPEMPEGMEWPEGERPEMPEGMEWPEGERPEPPEE